MSLDHALARLGRFARGVKPLRLLHRGPLKSSYLVERGGERLVVRVDAEPVKALGLDRESELRALRHAARLGVAPAPIAWRIKAPAVLVTRYVPGRSWRLADLREPTRLHQLARLLRRTHQPAPGLVALDLPGALHRYARHAAMPEAAAVLAEALRLVARLRPQAAVLCHHDPIGANVVGFRLPTLIDWEYAALGDPLFDLAVVTRHHNLTHEESVVLLSAYSAGPPLPRLAARLAGFQALYDRVLLLWLLAIGHEIEPSAAQQKALGMARCGIARSTAAL